MKLLKAKFYLLLFIFVSSHCHFGSTNSDRKRAEAVLVRILALHIAIEYVKHRSGNIPIVYAGVSDFFLNQFWLLHVLACQH